MQATFSRRTIRTYGAVLRVCMQDLMAYRANLILSVLAMFFVRLTTLFFWWVLYDASGREFIGDFTFPMMMTYIIGVGIVESVIHMNFAADAQARDINTGYLNALLVKPFHPVLFWWVRNIARQILMLGLMTMISAVIVILFRDLFLLPETNSLLLFLAVLPPIALFHFLLFNLFGMMAFWMGKSWGLTFIVQTLMFFATGGIIPIDLLSPVWSTFFRLLPFQFFGDIPVQIYMGGLSNDALMNAGLLFLVWTVVLAILNIFVYKRGVKSYGGYGG